ncbi:FAD-binding oxidoreductase [Thiohalorhabdus sp. Cl-TMA]|uniref:FAD-binding oxidoreductase n=1 Tax=Thiohalorhabdus methylotrophus TaxID=3242694 RepID=A0ABV4U008_9GAMM
MDGVEGNRIGERVDAAAWGAFSSDFRGRLIEIGDPEYEQARRIWNGMIDKHPALIAECRGTADVAAAVNLAREQHLEVAVRSGGHNVAGTSVCDGGIVIDLSAMRGVWVDPQHRRVRAQGGATLGDVDREAQAFGLATPLGAVSVTGIAGLTLNGGLGHLRRQFGLSCDNLTAMEIVTADGRIRTASPEENSDLFWALQGGGGNFGVVTAFEYRLHEVGPELFGLFVWHAADADASPMKRFREWAATAPREASVLAFYGFIPAIEEFPEEQWGQPCYALLGSYNGAPEEAERVFGPLREFARPVADFSGVHRYTELQTLLEADYPKGLHYYWKAVYLDDLTDPVLEFIARRGAASPSKLTTLDVWQLGGALSEVPREATAFWHRDKPYMLTFEANWEDPAESEANLTWVRESVAELRSMEGASGGYGNFPGLGEDPAQALYGDNHERLVAVKDRYDPDNLFHLNQNIMPAGGKRSIA